MSWWANLRCSSCSPLGEKSLWNGTFSILWVPITLWLKEASADMILNKTDLDNTFKDHVVWRVTWPMNSGCLPLNLIYHKAIHKPSRLKTVQISRNLVIFKLSDVRPNILSPNTISCWPGQSNLWGWGFLCVPEYPWCYCNWNYNKWQLIWNFISPGKTNINRLFNDKSWITVIST